MENKLKATPIERAVLDSYFAQRSNVRVELTHPLEERKTTLQIQDDLLPTLKIEDDVIVDYMLAANYQLVPNDDGSPIWQLWRMW